jgi:hypothetical protein
MINAMFTELLYIGELCFEVKDWAIIFLVLETEERSLLLANGNPCQIKKETYYVNIWSEIKLYSTHQNYAEHFQLPEVYV